MVPVQKSVVWKGRHGEDVKSLVNKSNNVNEEYKEAFRTKSYIDMWNKVQGQLETRTSLDGGSSSPPSPPIQQGQLSEYLLEPHQEILTSILENSSLHQSLISYFEISLEACQISELLLRKVHKVRFNYRTIKHATKLKHATKFIKRLPNTSSWSHDQYNATHRNLSAFALHKNPFSRMTPKKFHEVHDRHVVLLQELTSQCGKTKRRSKFIRCIKRTVVTFLVMGCGALACALLVAMMHSMVGMVAAPVLIVVFFCLFLIKRMKCHKQNLNNTRLERLGAQLDIAARGVYILINDFDTMSQLVQSLHDEMEHMKLVADICVRRKWKNATLKVVREFQNNESSFVEQLDELEKQIYLCFLNITRSRRLVMQEMLYPRRSK